MKSILIFLFLIFIQPLHLFSNEIEALLNSNYRLKIGSNSSWVDLNDSESHINSMIGISGTYEYTSWWHAIGEININQSNFDYFENDIRHNVSNLYLQAPMLLRFSKLKEDKTRYGFLIGSYVNYLLKTSEEDFFKGDVGGIIGLQYEWLVGNNKFYALEIRFGHGLKQFETFGRQKFTQINLSIDI